MYPKVKKIQCKDCQRQKKKQGRSFQNFCFLLGVINLGRLRNAHKARFTQSIGKGSRSKPKRSSTEAVPGTKTIRIYQVSEASHLLRSLLRQDPLSLPRHLLCHPVGADYQSSSIDEVEAITIDSNVTTI
ncbi:hypothetical protein V6N13_008124 [Hibiscus sabdariffa]